MHVLVLSTVGGLKRVDDVACSFIYWQGFFVFFFTELLLCARQSQALRTLQSLASRSLQANEG